MDKSIVIMKVDDDEHLKAIKQFVKSFNNLDNEWISQEEITLINNVPIKIEQFIGKIKEDYQIIDNNYLYPIYIEVNEINNTITATSNIDNTIIKIFKIN